MSAVLDNAGIGSDRGSRGRGCAARRLRRSDLELVGIEEVGNYAIQLAWGDGHATGIYSFRFLRELAEIG